TDCDTSKARLLVEKEKSVQPVPPGQCRAFDARGHERSCPSVGQHGVVGDDGDRCSGRLYGLVRGRLDNVAVAPSAKRVAVDLVAGRSDCPSSKGNDFGRTEMAVAGILHRNLPRTTARMMS